MSGILDKLKRNKTEDAPVEIVSDETAAPEVEASIHKGEAPPEQEETARNPVGDRVHEAADKVVDGSKKLATTVAEKTGEAVSYSKLKLKLHNHGVHRDKLLAALGSRTHELAKEKAAIYKDDRVQSLIEEVETLDKEIQTVKASIAAIGQ